MMVVLTLWMSSNRPFPYSSHVSKQKEMRTRLGWTISYKSLYFVRPRVGAFVYRNTGKVYSSNIFTTILVFAKREGKK